MDEETKKPAREGGVAESTGDTDIDQLLRARKDIDSALQRHKTQFTVLFCDIVGSTSFFERFGDTAGLMMLQRHHELVLPAIEAEGGTVVKTIGDAVLAVFGAPDAAVRTAIKVQQRLESYNEDRPQAEQIFTRVGLNFGTGFVKEKDIFGDVVNVAARIVKACAPAQVLISRPIYEVIREHKEFKCRALGSAVFRGKFAAEELYEVLWTSEEKYKRIRQKLDATEGAKTGMVLGKYEIMDELGRGAMGVVYKAYDPIVGRIVALKVVRLDAAEPERETLMQRLRQEAQAAGRLEHPNIVTIYDAGEAEGMFYLAMHFVKGRMLSGLIAERTLLPVNQIVLLMEQVCEGLDYAHERGIVHRDLKPSNIIITREGVAKIVDFGVAKVVEGGTTKAGMVLGTPSYMSPEQAQGGRVDRRSDIFALGAILYELLTGERAFPGNTPTAIVHKIIHEEPIPLRVVEPGIDPTLEVIVRKALMKDPFKRYQSCRELMSDLRAFRTGKRGVPEARELLADFKSETRTQAPAAAHPAADEARPGAALPRRVVRKKVVAKAEPVSTGRRVATAMVAVVLWAGLGWWSWQQGWLGNWAAMLTSRPSQPVAQPSASQPLPPPATGAQIPAQPSGPAGAAPGKEKASPPTSVPEKPPARAERGEGRKEKGSRTTKETQAAGAQEAPAGALPEEKETKAAKESEPTKEKPATQKAPALPPEQQAEVDRWFRQADDYTGKGRYQEAIFALEQVLRINPKNERAQQELERVKQMQELRKREIP